MLRASLTNDVVPASDVIVTMGYGDAGPIYPDKRYEDWVLDDPAGHGIDVVRRRLMPWRFKR